MGRAKIAMKFIENEKTRNKTYHKRKKGLIKKAHELSILCHVPICTIIYPYKEGNQPSLPEVYSFKGGEVDCTQRCRSSNSSTTCDHLDVARATDPNAAQEIIARYVACPKEEKSKRSISLFDIFDEQRRRAEQELSKLRQANAMAKYPTWNATFSGFSADQLVELLALLHQKLEFVGQRIAMIKGTNNNNNNNQLLGPNYDYYNNNQSSIDHYNHHHQPTPINSFMFHHQMEGFNQLVPFDPSNASTMFGDQIMHPMVVDHHHGNGGSNLVYNMNMMGPMYYDQGSGFVDDVPVASSSSSSYGPPGLSMSMPLYLPMLPNMALPKLDNK